MRGVKNFAFLLGFLTSLLSSGQSALAYLHHNFRHACEQWNFKDTQFCNKTIDLWLVNQSIDQSTDRSINQSINHLPFKLLTVGTGNKTDESWTINQGDGFSGKTLYYSYRIWSWKKLSTFPECQLWQYSTPQPPFYLYHRATKPDEKAKIVA